MTYPRIDKTNPDLVYTEKVHAMLRKMNIGEEKIIADNVKEENRPLFLRILIEYIQNEMGYVHYFDIELNGEMGKPETHTKFRKIDAAILLQKPIEPRKEGEPITNYEQLTPAQMKLWQGEVDKRGNIQQQSLDYYRKKKK